MAHPSKKPDYYYRVYIHPVLNHFHPVVPSFARKKDAVRYGKFLQGMTLDYDTYKVRKERRRRKAFWWIQPHVIVRNLKQ